MDDEVPVYASADEPAAVAAVSVREVADLVFEMLLLGAVFGYLLAARSNYVKLLFVPLAAFAWVLLRRLVELCRRIFSASTPSSPSAGG